jgi:DNA-binding PadR family transcriptional regulator
LSVRNALLGLLVQRPRHGYELRAAFEAVVGGEDNWDVKPAQIYSTLARLEKSGLVEEDSTEQDKGPERRVYAITPAGRKDLEQWLDTGIPREHQRDEFFIKLMICLASRATDPRRLIQTQRSHLYQEMHSFTAQRTPLDAKRELAKILLFDKALMHLEADVRWLDMIESRLDEIWRQPLPEPAIKPRGRPRKIEW